VIRIRCMGHIQTSVGSEMVELDAESISSTELIERLRERGKADPRLGFTKYNTILIVNDGVAFTAAADDRTLRNGDEVVLIPFSHGG
jgi:molybdopterin converting factor small subunit